MSAAIPPIINSVPLLITMSKSHYYLRFLSCKGKFGNINQDPQHNEDMFRERMKFGVLSKKIALTVLVSLSVLNLW